MALVMMLLVLAANKHFLESKSRVIYLRNTSIMLKLRMRFLAAVSVTLVVTKTRAAFLEEETCPLGIPLFNTRSSFR